MTKQTMSAALLELGLQYPAPHASAAVASDNDDPPAQEGGPTSAAAVPGAQDAHATRLAAPGEAQAEAVSSAAMPFAHVPAANGEQIASISGPGSNAHPRAAARLDDPQRTKPTAACACSRRTRCSTFAIGPDRCIEHGARLRWPCQSLAVWRTAIAPGCPPAGQAALSAGSPVTGCSSAAMPPPPPWAQPSLPTDALAMDRWTQYVPRISDDWMARSCCRTSTPWLGGGALQKCVW